MPLVTNWLELPNKPRTRDLGTYHVKVLFKNCQGFIYKYATGMRFCGGIGDIHPLNADSMPPVWVSEEELIHCIIFMFMEGDYSCDCNKKDFLLQTYHLSPDIDTKCGDSEELQIESLTLIKPDEASKLIYSANPSQVL